MAAGAAGYIGAADRAITGQLRSGRRKDGGFWAPGRHQQPLIRQTGNRGRAVNCAANGPAVLVGPHHQPLRRPSAAHYRGRAHTAPFSSHVWQLLPILHRGLAGGSRIQGIQARRLPGDHC